MLNIIKLGLVVAVLAAIGFAFNRTYEAGYSTASSVYKQAAAVETIRQARATQEALMVTNSQIAVLEARNEDLAKGLANETVLANQTTGAHNVCLPVVSVQRLNSVSPAAHTNRRPDYSKVSKARHVTKPTFNPVSG